MKLSHLFVLIAILVVLGVAIFFKQNQKPMELVTQEYAPILNLSFDPNQIDTITLSKQIKAATSDNPQNVVDSVELKKTDKGWIVKELWNLKADPVKVENLLAELKNLKGELRGKSADLFSDFGIDDDHSFRISLHDTSGAEVFVLRLGTKKPDFSSFFVREEGSEAVYLSVAKIYSLMGVYSDPSTESPKPDYWAALNFLEIDPNQVNQLELIRYDAGKPLTAIHVKGEKPDPAAVAKRWEYVRTETPFAINGEAVQAFISNMTNWQARKVLDPKAKDYGFSNPALTIKLGREEGEALTLTLSQPEKETENRFLQATGSPAVYEIPPHLYRNMNIDDSFFFVSNPLGIEDDKLEKLIIHADRKEKNLSPKGKSFSALTQYLSDLKSFKVERLLLDSKIKSGGKYWLEYRKTGENNSQFIDIGDLLAGDPKEYAVAKRGTSIPFAISEALYKKLFEDLDRLSEPK